MECNRDKWFQASRALFSLALYLVLSAGPEVLAQVPVTLTDRIYKGQGVIDLLKDVGGEQLALYFDDNGTLFLGVDLNEDLRGNETKDSIGVAIKQVELLISTTAGDFTFSDFYTSTTAQILEQGASASQEFYTLFGKSGSSEITGSSAYDLGKLDDVLEIRNVSLSGTIIRAELRVTFLQTADTGVEGNETFFDFSNGFEEFALLGRADAMLLEDAGFGLAAAPENITYSAAPVSTVPAAPAPPWVVAAGLAALLLLRRTSI